MVGKIVTVVDKREVWHPLFNNRKYRILEKNYFVDYQHEYILEPYGWTEEEMRAAFNGENRRILVQEEDLSDLVFESGLEPTKELRYPHIFNVLGLNEKEMYI